MVFRLTNTLTGKKENFKPSENKLVKMYVCGITPYDEPHIGHARCYVFFDVLRRYLEYKKYNVKYVQNFTDIDDKIIKKSKELGISPKEVSEKYISQYLKNCEQLNIKHATIYPKVTEHIPQIIDFIQKLIELSYGYVKNGSVYFRIDKFKEYGKLSKRKKSEMLAGARVEIDEKKENPLDFVLWKESKHDEPYFNSPWGKGRPGWHIECSTMAIYHLGETLDIHGGGSDLIFPHHENEIVQSESLTGKPFSNFWVHNEFVMIKKQKMSKSLGNIIVLDELFKNYSPEVVRYFLLSYHYKTPIDFSLDYIEQAKAGYNRLVRSVENSYFLIKNLLNNYYREKKEEMYNANPHLKEKKEAFFQALDNDLNTAEAIGHLHNLAYSLNCELQKNNPDFIIVGNVVEDLLDMLEVLGIKLKLSSTIEQVKETREAIESLIKEREEARKRLDFSTADQIRRKLQDMGIILEDTPFGTRWRKK